ncbi:MAG: hypothetical protein V4857_29810 [Pseudomonadota bacterium]
MPFNTVKENGPTNSTLPTPEAGLPVDATELARLNGYAEFVLNALREQRGDGVGYDEKSLAVLSKNVSSKRLGYDSVTAGKVATLYGAFMGRTLIDCFPKAAPAWVRADGGLGIAMRSPSGEISLVFPIASLTSHIEQGDEFSLLRCFTAVATSLAAPPPAPLDQAGPEAMPSVAAAASTLPEPVVDVGAASEPVAAASTASAPVAEASTPPYPVDEVRAESEPVAAASTPSDPVDEPSAASEPVAEASTASSPAAVASTPSDPVSAPAATPIGAPAAEPEAAEVPAFKAQAPSGPAQFDVGPDDQGNPFILHVPVPCCNCLSHTYPVARDTPLALKGKGSISVRFAYCGRCARTAHKPPFSPAVLGTVFGLSYAGLVVAAAWFDLLLPAAVLLPPLIAAYAHYRLTRVEGQLGSNYQPVRLAGLDKGPLGIKQIVLCFSKPEYAHQFELLNAERIADGALKVTLARHFRWWRKA